MVDTGRQVRRILVIDDSLTFLHAIKRLLQSEGQEIHTAQSGEEGLDRVAEVRPDLVIVDHVLPGMQGDEVLRRLKMNTATRNIPVLMLTMKSGREDMLHGLDTGADEYLSKNEDLDVLRVRVERLLRKSEGMSGAMPASGTLFRRSKILAIDDDAFFLKVLRKMLEKEGFEVEEATSGAEGLALIRETMPDCILLDLVMPDVNGDEICRQLKEDEHTREIPVVILTSSSEKKALINGLSAGADDFVNKPVDREILKGRIQALLRRKYYQDENRRIQEELRARELEAARAKADRDLAQTRAQMADALTQKNFELEATNRKLRDTQAQLIQSEKMAALGQLVAGIAHEINNPLAFIANNMVTIRRDLEDLDAILESYRGTSRVLESSAPDHWEEIARLEADLDLPLLRQELERQLRDTQEGLDRVKNIVMSLRNFSRLDEGEVKVVDVTEGLESTLNLSRHLFQDRIALERDYTDVPRIECYPSLLNQVFMNLVVNACQAIPDRGTITVRTRHDSRWVRVSVQDDGTGVPPELLDKIFDPFFTTKEVGKGTGLGLSVSYGIIEKHGGRIEIESLPGVGTTFTVVLPHVLGLRRREDDRRAAADQDAPVTQT